MLGWKTSVPLERRRGLGNGTEPYLGPWSELLYPPGHLYEGQSIDLAFEIWALARKTRNGHSPAALRARECIQRLDQYSMYSFQLAADDWICTTDNR